MTRLALTVRAEAMEPVLDHLLPRFPQASTVDRDGGLTHFVAHAIVRQVPPA